nr:ABC transporter permease subunit [Priestia taiwanensis]
MMLLSIGNTIFYDGHIREVRMLMPEDGKVTAAPFPPSSEFLLGTDSSGKDLLQVVIEGAKWTIGAAFFIGVLRIIFGMIFGIVVGIYVRRGFKKIEAFFDSFSVLPLTLIAYFLLVNVLMFSSGEDAIPFYYRLFFQVGVVTCLAVPPLAFYIANEVRKIGTEEFVVAAKVLGAGRWEVFRRHVFPHLSSTLPIVFMQQFVQVLVLFLHLGILNLFFGGTIVASGAGDMSFYSVTNEWSGLIGGYFRSLSSHPWIPLTPILCFTLTIMASNMILASIQGALEKRKVIRAQQKGSCS